MSNDRETTWQHKVGKQEGGGKGRHLQVIITYCCGAVQVAPSELNEQSPCLSIS